MGSHTPNDEVVATDVPHLQLEEVRRDIEAMIALDYADLSTLGKGRFTRTPWPGRTSCCARPAGRRLALGKLFQRYGLVPTVGGSPKYGWARREPLSGARKSLKFI